MLSSPITDDVVTVTYEARYYITRENNLIEKVQIDSSGDNGHKQFENTLLYNRNSVGELTQPSKEELKELYNKLLRHEDELLPPQ